TWLRDVGTPFAIVSLLNFPGTLMGLPLATWTINFEMSTVLIAGGAIVGWKICWSMMLGAILNYFILLPYAVHAHAIPLQQISFRSLSSWSIWMGSAMMISASLLQLAFNWGSFRRTFYYLFTRNHHRGNVDQAVPASNIEVPNSWFLLGTTISGLGC